ncbi:MAG: C1 family peptidase [Candidatus Zixiibacteriota bacterium]
MRSLSIVCTLGICILFLAGTAVSADKGGIPKRLIDSLNAVSYDNMDKTIADIVANGDINSVALNRERFIEHNKFVNLKIKTGEITNQKSSGRCWMFSGLNILRPQAMKNLKNEKLQFSQNYLMFYDKMEKYNTFLQYMIDFADRPLDDRELQILIDGPGGDGGWWTYFTGLIKRYGLVPIEAMPETHNSSSSGKMNEFLTMKGMQFGVQLREQFAAGTSKKDLVRVKEGMLAELYQLLVLHLGQPPTEFVWRHESSDTTVKGTITETYTPQSFAKAALSDDFDDYVALFNYPGKPFMANYSVEMSRNIYTDQNFSIVNVPVDTMMAYAFASLLDSTPVWFACDVGKEDYTKDGIMALNIYNYEDILGTKFDLPKKDLIQMMVITPNHAMAFMGIDTADGKPVKWLVENSWGGDKGDGGYWYMYNDWFRRYMFGVVIHKRYLSKQLIDISRTEPMILKPWDPMYSLNRLN